MSKEGQNHIGHIYLFAINLAPLTPNRIGANWRFVFKKRGPQSKKEE
jgi:hypothetical protein